MSRLIQYWSSTYFTGLLLTITLLLAFIVSISKRKKHPQFKILPFYFGAFIILQLFFYLKTIFFNSSQRTKILWLGDYMDGFVTLIEFFAFIYLFPFIIRNNNKKKLIKWLTIAGLIIAMAIILKDILFDGTLKCSSLSNIYIIESLILLIPCFFYYRELFTFLPNLSLLQDANFWTVTGLTFYLICTLPVSFVLVYFIKTDYITYLQIYSIIYLFYILLFIMIIKSYLCKATNLI